MAWLSMHRISLVLRRGAPTSFARKTASWCSRSRIRAASALWKRAMNSSVRTALKETNWSVRFRIISPGPILEPSRQLAPHSIRARRRPMRFLGAALVLALSSVPLCAEERFDVRVLYCGDPKSAREAAYGSFLKRNFTNVTFRDAREFRESDARGHDLVIFDWSSVYDGKGNPENQLSERYHGGPSLSLNYARPTILVGWAGGTSSSQFNLKINWLCLCLTGPAFKPRLGHRLFHSPLEVAPKLEDVPTPGNYPFLSNERLGPTMKVWKVQTKNYPDVDPGLVSTLYGFDDSPDAEVVAQGFAAKGPDTVTLGRHANFFLWGFSASPTDMRPAAQRLFVNVICYMRHFDGRRPIVRSIQQSREWALRYAISVREFSDAERQREIQALRAAVKQHPEFVPERRRGNVEAFVAEQFDRHQKSDRAAWERQIPENLRKQFGTNADKYVEYYRTNLEYLQPGVGGFVVDEDVKAIGVSNRRVELIDRCVSMLEHNDRAQLARRVLTRYTDEAFEAAPEWRKWLEQNRDSLFFSDVGGYRFFIDTAHNPPSKSR